MLRLIAVAGFALSIATAAQGMSPAPLPQPDNMVSQIAAGCGALRGGAGSGARAIASSTSRPRFRRSLRPVSGCRSSTVRGRDRKSGE